MCGRYTLIADLGDLAQRFEFDGSDFSYDPGYNIAPTESILTVRNVEGREAAFMKLGAHTLLGQGPENRGPDDQRPGGDGGREARLPKRPEKTALPGPRRRLLRVAEDACGQEALSDNHEVWGALCHGRAVGDVAGPTGQRRAILHHHHDRGQRLSCADTQQDACHPASGNGGVVVGHGTLTIAAVLTSVLIHTTTRTRLWTPTRCPRW